MSSIPAVQRIVMFKHGIAYFERGGPVDGPFELSFKKDEMNDVLKSLTVWVESGDAQIGVIAFDKPDDPAAALAERKLNLGAGAALSGLLGAFSGRSVSVEAGGLRKEGEIVGLEMGRIADGAERTTLVLRTADGTIELIDLAHAKALEFADVSVRADLALLVDRSRAVTAGSSRAVRVALAGKADDLRVSYIVPAPAWRVTYRIACEQAATTLMAWGIVHNPADENIDNASLTLTTGHPVSFMIDLYNPKTVRRVQIEEAARVAAVPRAARDLDIGTMLGSLDDDAPVLSSSRGVETLRLGGSLSRAGAAMTGVTEGADRGEFFEYRVASRVSLRRGGSAMVPLLSTAVEARRQRVWRRGGPLSPDIVLTFANNTGAVLEEGAAVIYDESVYAGESMFPYSARGADVRLVFAKDLAVRCRHDSKTQSVASAIRLARDTVVEELRFEEHHELTAESDHQEEIEVVFELPRNPSRSIDPGHAQPASSTHDTNCFAVKVPPRSRAAIKVVERWLGDQRHQYTGFSADDMQRWLDKRFLDQETHKVLAGVLATRDRIRELQQQIERATKEREAAYAKQKSLSEQLAILKEGGKEGELRLRYVGELEATQDKGNELSEEITRLKGQIDTCNKEGNDRLRAIIGAPARGS
jgi:hypothetical protein